MVLGGRQYFWRKPLFLTDSVAVLPERSIVIVCRIFQNQDEYASVGVKLPTRSRLGSGQRIGRRDMIPLHHQARTGEGAIYVLAFAIDRGVNFMRDTVELR